MLQFIVLGYVPGTTIQLTFFDWLIIVAVSCVLLWIISLILGHLLRRRYRKLATNFYPYLKFRRRKDSFSVRLNFA